MATFSSDADLLAYEPNVFNELPFASQRKVRVTDAVVSGSGVTSATGGFGGASVHDVAVIEASPAESSAHAILQVTSNTAMILTSFPMLSARSGLTLTVRTFEPQAQLVHDELLRALGIDPDDGDAAITEEAIVSIEVMRSLECLGTLSRAYAAGVAIVGDSTELHKKAENYRLRFNRACRGAMVLLDLDGDGQADAWRSPGLAKLVRA